MSFGTKKIRKFLSLSLITSSFCLPWFSKVNAGLKGRIATMEDFRKFTSELESIFEKISKDYEKKAIESNKRKAIESSERKAIESNERKAIKKYYNMLTNNEENANLEFARQILKILEKNGIKSDILMIERSVGEEKSSYASVIYPIGNSLGEIQIVIVDPIKLLRYYFGADGSLISESWRNYCCLDVNDYLSSTYSWLEGKYAKVFVRDGNNRLVRVSAEGLMNHHLNNTNYSWSEKNVFTRVFVHNNDKRLGEMSVKYWILNAMGATKEEDQRKIYNFFGLNSCAIY